MVNAIAPRFGLIARIAKKDEQALAYGVASKGFLKIPYLNSNRMFQTKYNAELRRMLGVKPILKNGKGPNLYGQFDAKGNLFVVANVPKMGGHADLLTLQNTFSERPIQADFWDFVKQWHKDLVDVKNYNVPKSYDQHRQQQAGSRFRKVA